MKFYQTDLFYCLNIHAGDSWLENFNAIKQFSEKVHEELCPNKPFALGLRLSNRAAIELEEEISSFKAYLKSNNMYVIAINGFPFGDFHKTPVKNNVYLPDWSSPERVQYTIRLTRILAELLQDDHQGSITTSPLCYGKEIDPKCYNNLILTAKEMEEICKRKGCTISLALEPEPDCALENSDECINFFDTLKNEYQYNGDTIGICLDMCHLAMQFETLPKALNKLTIEDINVTRIQISSCLSTDYRKGESNPLTPFADPLYLHQTRIKTSHGITAYPDLPDAIKKQDTGLWLTHFHIPIYQMLVPPLKAVPDFTDELILEFLRNQKIPLEIETYTFDCIPGEKLNIVDSIVKEYRVITGTN